MFGKFASICVYSRFNRVFLDDVLDRSKFVGAMLGKDLQLFHIDEVVGPREAFISMLTASVSNSHEFFRKRLRQMGSLIVSHDGTA